MLLTEQEVDALRKSLPAVCKHQDVIRAAESAVLEKLKTQEPGITFDGMTALEFIGKELFEFQEATGCCTADEYLSHKHPLPPADVVRDAERYRWLRDSGKGDDLIRGDCRGVYLPESAALDRAIDSAMEKA